MSLKNLLSQMEKTQWEKRLRPLLKGKILTRCDLQKIKAPQGDFTARTSGSTGVPVEVQRTRLSQLWWNATNLREVLWHKRDLSQPFAVIRPFIQKKLMQPQWGPAFSLLGKTGPLYAHPVQGDLNAWLKEIQPGYLMTLPSILETIDLSGLPRLKGIKTTGETLRHKHSLIADMYSSEEVGTIAIQCPDNPDAYHVMENILIEILDEKNCPADVGKVVLTDLTSRYLHRYEIGDYAEMGECPCGRGLQTIKKILGRRRNLVTLPDGSSHWPLIGSPEYLNIALLRRYQVIQTSLTTLQFRYIVDDELNAMQKEAFTELIRRCIGYPFAIEFIRMAEFPPGKFEEFISHVTTGHRSASS